MQLAVKDYGQVINQQITDLSGSTLDEDFSDESASEEALSEPQQRLQELELKRDQVKNLFREIKSIGRGHGGDDQLAALLANIGYLRDFIVHFNCKSGEDRTGLMDAKSKHLARELHANRKQGDASVPGFAPFSERSFEPEQRHQQMLWEGGNLQVLEQNVGGQSLKVVDLAAVPGSIDANLREDLGGEAALKEIQGLKRYTNIDTIAKLTKKDQAIKQAALNQLETVLKDLETSLEESGSETHPDAEETISV